MRFCSVLVALSLGLPSACGNPQPVLTAVEPLQAYSDQDVRLTLLGQDFLPATDLDPVSGRRIATSDGFHARIGAAGTWLDLSGIAWLSTGALAASLTSATAQRLPPGELGVEVTDPRGHTARLDGAFLELGADATPPSLAFTGPPPAALFAPGMVLRGSLHAAEIPPGSLASMGWNSYENGQPRAEASCSVTPGATEADCDFVFTIGSTLKRGDVVLIVADATDASTGNNRVEASLSFILRDRPQMISMSPVSGGTAGGTDVVIVGSGFLPGSQVTVDGELLFPDGGTIIDEYTISGHVPAHAPGPASLFAHTPLGDSPGAMTFTYVPPPSIASIAPDTGAADGGTAVTISGSGFSGTTRIYFGQSLDTAAPLADLFLQSDSSIVGHAPAGDGATTVWAFDSTLGFTKLQGGFTWRTP